VTASTDRTVVGKVTAACLLSATATALTLLGLYVFAWWPSRFANPTFLEFRADYVADLANGDAPWWNVFADSYFVFGFGVQTAAFVVLPFVVASRGRLHWLSAIAVLASIWEVIGVKGGSLIFTTAAPWLGPLAGVLALIGWRLARSARRSEL
jgi:hypothetical protein